MTRWKRIARGVPVLALAASLLVSGAQSAVSSQDHEHGHAHSEVGTVTFPTSCAPAAQAEFEHGVALLHSFWFVPAREAFTTVTEADPACAMGYWGIAMTWLGNPLTGSPPPPAAMQAGWTAIDRAASAGARTDRERGFIDALTIMYRDPDVVDHRGRTHAYADAMEQLATRFPDDFEAAVFYALALDMTYDLNDKTYANALKAASVLERLFAQHPEHPGITHYLIHSYDYPPLAQRGLSSAFLYADLAPAVPHAQHMPSHIFTRVGYWQDSVDANTRSLAAIVAGLGERQPRVAFPDEIHPMDYLVYAHLQMAQDDRARGVRDDILAFGDGPANAGTAYGFAAVPARYALERSQWADAAALALHPAAFPWTQFPEGEAVTTFAQGLGAARSGNAIGAQQAAVRLTELRDRLTEIAQDYWAEQVDIQRTVVLAWAARADGRNTEALELMRTAAQREDATEKHIVTPGPLAPARELLGEMLLELGAPAEALVAFEASHQVEPNRFKGLYGAARAARQVGNAELARTYYGRLIELGQGSTRPELQEARAFLQTQ